MSGRKRTAAVIAAAVILCFAWVAGTAHAVGIDDNCPALDDDKNLIIRDEAVIYGTPRSDHICGGPSANFIIGGLLDDEIYAGGGDDIVIGGHGVDTLDGGSGNDWLRGGTNPDRYYGGFNGSGTDTVSFADMTPSGSAAGVTVDLVSGTANAGEESSDILEKIDNVVGSAFNDTIRAGGGAATQINGGFGDDRLNGTEGNDSLWGEDGSDTCTNEGFPAACADGQGLHRPSTAYVLTENRSGKDYGLVVMGAEGATADTLSVTRTSETQLRVTGGARLGVGGNCRSTSETVADCTLSGARYVVVWGDAGTDRLTMGDRLTVGAGSIDVNGGPGNDTLTGGAGEEVLFTGEGGADTLRGNANFDALISEGDPVGSGGDYLDGGAGDDQLVTDNACAGHTLWGNEGSDIIGFARQRSVGGALRGVHAQLGEGAASQQAWAINEADQEVSGCLRSTINGGGETLEGTSQNDVLSGNETVNTLWGLDGNDTLTGRGGNDTIEGHRGADTLYGNEGNDTLRGFDGDDVLWGYNGVDAMYGGSNWDELHAVDGAADSVIDCGLGYDPGAERDLNYDPAGVGCNDRIPVNTGLTMGLLLHGQPGYVSLSGNVRRADDNAPVSGYVNVVFEKVVGGSWSWIDTVQLTLANGYYEINHKTLGDGQWRVRTMFPPGQWRYADSESGNREFRIKERLPTRRPALRKVPERTQQLPRQQSAAHPVGLLAEPDLVGRAGFHARTGRNGLAVLPAEGQPVQRRRPEMRGRLRRQPVRWRPAGALRLHWCVEPAVGHSANLRAATIRSLDRTAFGQMHGRSRAEHGKRCPNPPVVVLLGRNQQWSWQAIE